MRLQAALREAAAALSAAGLDEPRRQARRIVEAALELPPATLIADPERALSGEEHARIRAVLDRVLAREPLSRIQGRREFWGLDFRLSPETLDPRPDTETVVEAVLRRLPDRGAPLVFLDLGTGSGCILLALLSECPVARGLGVDVSAGAAATARANAEALGFGRRARFVVGDWAAAIAGQFDAIVANPPYIPTGALTALPREVAGYDPARALDGGADGLCAYRRIAGEIGRLLRPAAIFACEIGCGQEAAVGAILAAQRLGVEPIERDLAGIGRVIVARR